MPQYAPRSARRHVRAGEFLTIPICPSLRGWPAPGTAALSGFPPTARDVAGSRSRPSQDLPACPAARIWFAGRAGQARAADSNSGNRRLASAIDTNAGRSHISPRLGICHAWKDTAAFATYRSDPVIARYQSWTAPVSLESAASLVRKFAGGEPEQPGWFQYAVELRVDRCLVGDVGVNLHESRMQAEIGFTLASERQGQGYATEAVSAVLQDLFERRGLHRVSAECDARNLSSARLLERVGFRGRERRRGGAPILPGSRASGLTTCSSACSPTTGVN